VIQISPQSEIIEVPGVEYTRKPGPMSSAKGAVKKGGAGVFEKILASLLRKTGEKDAEGSEGALSAFDAEGALFPSIQRSGEKGPSAFMSGIAGKTRLQGKIPENEAGAPRAAADRPVLGKDGETGKVRKARVDSSSGEEIFPGADYPLARGAGEIAPAGETDESAEGIGAVKKSGAAAAGAAGGAAADDEARLLSGLSESPAEPDASAALYPDDMEAPGLLAARELSASVEARGKDAESRNARFEPGLVEELSGEDEPSEGGNRVLKKTAGAGLNHGRLEETRREKRRVSLEVYDLRSAEARMEKAENSGELLKTEAAAQGEGGTRDITVELHSAARRQDAPSQAETGWETRSGRAFEDLLARELHQNLNSDIVRHASVLLKDGGEGTIRLSLKPESLGNVKIRLEMAENKITGHIVVESEEALRAFEREIHSLEQTFKDSGFQGANLEMSLAADGRGADQQWKGEEAGLFLSGQLAASRYEALERADMADIGAPDAYQQGRNFINVLA
jgi:hypothetical protein